MHRRHGRRVADLQGRADARVVVLVIVHLPRGWHARRPLQHAGRLIIRAALGGGDRGACAAAQQHM
eukprot:3776610-Pyramimonas_sp.AAC.1